MRKNYARDGGYTLIEILVVLTIIGIIFGLGYAAFQEFSRRQSVSAFKRRVVGDLRLAQTQALAGKKPDDIKCREPNTLRGFGIRFVSETNYRIEADCTGGFVVIKDVVLPTDYYVDGGANDILLFKVLGEGTNIASSYRFDVGNRSGSVEIIVSSGGTIE